MADLSYIKLRAVCAIALVGNVCPGLDQACSAEVLKAAKNTLKSAWKAERDSMVTSPSIADAEAFWASVCDFVNSTPSFGCTVTVSVDTAENSAACALLAIRQLDGTDGYFISAPV